MSRTVKNLNNGSPSAGKKPTGYWALNFRLLVKTAVIVAIAAPAIYLWHARQVSVNAAALLTRAATHEEREDWAQAADILHRYVQLEPANAEAHIRIAKAFDHGAQTAASKRRAVELYGAAIAMAPSDDELRRRQMSLQLEVGDYRAALEQANRLLKKRSEDSLARRIKAVAMHQAAQHKAGISLQEEVIPAFETAIEKNPNNAELAAELAGILRGELTLSGPERDAAWKQADEVLDHLVESSSDQAEACLARYLYRSKFTLPGADADLDRALEADSARENLEVQRHAGDRALAAGEWQAAAAYFERMIEIAPQDRRGYLGLGQAQSGEGHDESAIQSWQEGLRLVGPNDVDLQLQIAAACVRLAKWEEAEESLKNLESLAERIYGPAHSEFMARIALLRAETLLEKGAAGIAATELKQAIRLDQAGAESRRKRAFKRQCLERLGQCYSLLQQWDQAAAAYQEAADLAPAVSGLRLAAARAWEQAGRRDEAARQYEEALTSPEVEPAAWLDFARLEFQRQLAFPPGQQNWKSLAKVLSRAEEKLPQAPALQILKAESATVEGHSELALKILHSVEPEALKSNALIGPLALAYERAARPEEADRVLKAARKQADSPQLALLGAELLVRRNRLKDAIRLLADSAPKAPRQQAGNLLYRLATLRLAAGDLEQAKEDLKKLAADNPRDIRPLQFLAELALQTGDLKEVEKRERELESREGAEGTNWRFYRAQRLTAPDAAAAGKKTDADVKRAQAEAERLQKEIEHLRPGWSPGYLLKGKLAQQRSVPDSNEAIRAYMQAIKLGERRISVYESLIQLLFRQNRVSEAEHYLDQLRQAVSLPPELAPVAMAIDVRQGNLQRAIETARAGVEEQPDSAESHLRLGYLLSLQTAADDSQGKAQRAQAEAELKQARQLNPHDIQTWSALLSFYINGRQTEAAHALLDELKQHDVLSAEQQPFFLAQAYAALGEREQAKAYYLKAIEQTPDRPNVQIQAAQFFLKSEPEQAEKCLRRALAVAPDNRPAARLLAILLANGDGTEESLSAVWRLLEADEAPETVQAPDRRLQAILLMRRGGSEYRRRARVLLEALAADPQNVAPIDRLLLARLYEAAGEMAAAREQLQVLVNTERPAADHLAAYVNNLLRAGQPQRAGNALDQLAKSEPETTSFRTLVLRCRWLKAQNERAKASAYIKKFLEAQLPGKRGSTEQAGLLASVASLYADLELNAEAERYFREAVEKDRNRHPALANWLVRQNRTSEAVQLCLQIAANDPTPRSAITLNSLLVIGNVSAEDRKAVAAVLQRADAMFPENVELLFSASSRCLMGGDDDEAIRLLRKLLKMNPKLQPALNNLAVILARRPECREEALQTIDRAIALAGMAPELVDSKGWILLQQGKLEAAETLFKEAISAPPANARHYFHLALVYQLQGKLPEAREAWQDSLESDLEKSVLSPDERAEYAKLKSALR